MPFGLAGGGGIGAAAHRRAQAASERAVRGGPRRRPGAAPRCQGDAVQGEQAEGVPVDQGHDERVKEGDLAVRGPGRARQLAQRDPGLAADDRAGPGPQRRQAGDQVSVGVRGDRARSSSGPVTIRARPRRSPGSARSGAAPVAVSAGLLSPRRPVLRRAAALPDCAARAALTVSSGRICPGGGDLAGRSGPPRRPARLRLTRGGQAWRRSCRCPRSRPRHRPNPPSQTAGRHSQPR